MGFFFWSSFLYVNLHSMIVWLFYMALMSPVFLYIFISDII